MRNIDQEAEAEFLALGYVTGGQTLYSGVNKLEAGEYFCLRNGEINLQHYYIHAAYETTVDTDSGYFKKLELISQTIFERLLRTIGDKTVVVPLSGGYDSRYIVTTLYKLNFKKVICFSYGKQNNYEAKISRKVAEKLGYKWYFIEYSNQLLKDFLDDDFKKYCIYASNFSSLPHIQDYFAVRYLKEKGLVPQDSIFIPGHTGDLLCGKHSYKEIIKVRKDIDLFNVPTLIFLRHYVLNSVTNDECAVILSKIERFLISCNALRVNNIFNLFDLWDATFRQAGFIVNSVRVYEYFGYDWRVPLWDDELVDFFWKLPLYYRTEYNLYELFLFRKLFIPYGVQYRKTRYEIIQF